MREQICSLSAQCCTRWQPARYRSAERVRPVKLGKPKRIRLITNFDDDTEKQEGLTKLSIIAESLKQYDVQLEVQVNPHLHDREIRLSSGWTVKIGRGFDIYQRPDDWLNIGANDLDLRPCLETTVNIFLTKMGAQEMAES